MKEYVQVSIVFVIFLMIIPATVFVFRSGSQKAEKVSASADKSVEIYFTDEKKSRTYSSDEYMIGSVMAQMPYDFNDEALKAQAVLAHTYILHRFEEEKSSPTESLHGCIVSDDTTKYQGFFTEEQAKNYYGNKYDDAYKKISAAVKAVKNVVLTYDGKPIIVAFHAISSGVTESAEKAWGEKIPYLQSVTSSSDKNAEGCECTVTLTSAELKKKLSAKYTNITFTDLSDAEKWLTLTTDTATSYNTAVSVCGTSISGNDFCEAVGISSPCFTYTFSNTKFTFTSHGYGHLVGMSQYGANTMGCERNSYKNILTHYFKGTKLESVS